MQSIFLIRRRSFNLKREAAPLATRSGKSFLLSGQQFQSQARSRSPGYCESAPIKKVEREGFNLKREAAPLATWMSRKLLPIYLGFQSQARSRSPGYAYVTPPAAAQS